MDNTYKKMMLVNPEMSRAMPTATEKKLSELDKEITGILNSNLPDDIKAKHYMNALKSHKFFETPQVKTVNPDVEILKNIPLDQKVRAKDLLSRIKPFLTWNEEGEIIANGAVVPYSNISSLILDLLTEKQLLPAKEPIGWEDYEGALKAARIPEHLILNEDRRRRLTAKRTSKRKTKGKTPRKLIYESQP